MIHTIRLVWRDPILLMLAAAFVLFGCFVASVGIYQSLLAVTVFGIGDAEFSLILAGAMVINVGASIGIGILTDQKARRRTVAIGSALAFAAGSGLVTLVPTPLSFVVTHVLLIPAGGTLFGQFFALSRLAAGSYDKAHRDGILAVVRAAFAVPFVIVLPLWGLAFDSGVQLVTIYPVVAGFAVLLAYVLWRYWPADGTAPWSGHRSGLSIRGALAEMAALPVLARVALVGTIHVGSAVAGVIIGLLFDEASGRGAGDVGLFFGLFVAVEVVVTLMIGTIAFYWSRMTIITAGVVLYAIFLIGLPGLAPTPWLWLLLLPAGIGGALIYTLAISYVQDLLGARAGAGAALLALQRIATDGIGATVFAIGTWFWGYALVAYLAATVTLIAITAIWVLDTRAPIRR